MTRAAIPASIPSIPDIALFPLSRGTPNDLPLTGRWRAKRGGYPTAMPLGAPVERRVRRHSIGISRSRQIFRARKSLISR